MSVEVKDVLAATLPGVLPTLMVLVGILTNKNDINHVRTEIASLRTEVGAMRNQFHADILNLVNIGNEMDKRVSRLEDQT